jgi:hypothetical protein
MGKLGTIALLLAASLGACKSGKNGIEHTIPHDVHAGYTAACKADTATLKTAEETSFAATDGYKDQASPLHTAAAAGASYTITIRDKRCGVVGHTVGQTPTDY